MKILLVDDVPMYVELLREPLAWRGYSPVVATSATEGREEFARHQPRLVFLDLRMPDEDGDRLCREIKAGAADAAVPVVMTGVGGREDERRRCEQAGCDAFLAKPVRPAVALGTVARFLRIRERSPRVPLRVPVLCEGLGLTRLVEAVNVSSGGLFVATSRPLPPGTRVTVEFRLPLHRADAPLRVRGRVCWINGAPQFRQDAPVGMAVRFDALEPAVQAAVDRFVGRSLAADRVAPGRLVAAPGRFPNARPDGC